MKILTTIISHSKNNRIHSFLETWMKDITHPHDYLIIGDEKLSQRISDKCIFFNDCYPENRKVLSLKIYRTIEYIIKNYDFDFWHKCDDDVVVNYKKLISYLKKYESSEDIYIGHRTFNRTHRYYAAGFNYIVSRNLLQKIFEILNKNPPNETTNPHEDWVVGDAIKECNVNLIHDDNFVCPQTNISPAMQFEYITKNPNLIAATIHKESSVYIPKIYRILKVKKVL